jgi:hypothetical protein
MINRAQCSLIVEDAELYTNLVQPLKSSKQLSAFVLRLLGAYYHNPEVQSLVDAVPNHADDDFLAEVAQQFKETREAFSMLDYLTQSADATISDGIAKMREYMETPSDAFGTPIVGLKESPVDAYVEAKNLGKEQKKAENERLTQLEEGQKALEQSLNTLADTFATKLDLIVSKITSQPATSTVIPVSVSSEDINMPPILVSPAKASESPAPVLSEASLDDMLNSDSDDDDDFDIDIEEEGSSESASVDAVGLMQNLMVSVGIGK